MILPKGNSPKGIVPIGIAMLYPTQYVALKKNAAFFVLRTVRNGTGHSGNNLSEIEIVRDSC